MITAEIPHNKALEAISITRCHPHIAPRRKGPDSSASLWFTGRSFNLGGQTSGIGAAGPTERGEETSE